MYRQRFGLTGHPLPQNAQGKTFFDKSPGYGRLRRRFQTLIQDPGLGILTGDAGVGKTSSIRNLCVGLPRPDHTVLYLCDTTASPLDLYRALAQELGVRPAHRRAQLWADIKKTLAHMVDERGIRPLVIIDGAHHLQDGFLADLDGFLNFGFDSRSLLTVWLVGLPALSRHLHMQQHATLAMRIVANVHLEPLDRETFFAMLDHALKAAGAQTTLLSDTARELFFRSCRGVPGVASQLLRLALGRAHERDQNFVDDHILEAALDEMMPSKVAA